MSLIVGGVMIAALSGCAPGPTKPTATPSAAPGSDWSYSGSNGPEHWAKYGAACENAPASEESPIDIDTAALSEHPSASPVALHYVPAEFELEDNGHTIEAVAEDPRANSVELQGTTYYLQQFHFHAESEHQIDGESKPAELHLVNEADDGTILVLGILLETGDDNEELSGLFDAIPRVAGDDDAALPLDIDPSRIIPSDTRSVQYEGSLTTPPCTEGVRWNVFLSAADVSAEQLESFTDVYSENHRPVQPLHDRQLVEVGGSTQNPG